MTRKAVLCATILLSACGTPVDVYHSACMEGNRVFAAQVACVRANVEADASKRGDTLVQEYLITGDLLVKDVAARRLSEDQARLEFQKKLNEIRERELAIMAEEAKIRHYQERHFPTFSTCRKNGNIVNCTNY